MLLEEGAERDESRFVEGGDVGLALVGPREGEDIAQVLDGLPQPLLVALLVPFAPACLVPLALAFIAYGDIIVDDPSGVLRRIAQDLAT